LATIQEELVEIITGEIQIMPTCSLTYLKLHTSRWSEIDYETTKGQLLDRYLVKVRYRVLLLAMPCQPWYLLTLDNGWLKRSMSNM
jgi:hypothetical protein